MQAKQLTRHTEIARPTPRLLQVDDEREPPPSNVALSENELFQMLAQLEHVRAGFEEPNWHDDPATIVELIHGMVAHVVSFAETNLLLEGSPVRGLTEAMAKAGNFFQDCHHLQGELRQSTWRSVMGWFKKTDAGAADRQQRVRQILEYGVAVMADYVGVCCNCMSPSAARSCSEASNVFLNDLKRLIALKPR